jgi:transcriptional regulator with XRE-family HTH domain
MKRIKDTTPRRAIAQGPNKRESFADRFAQLITEFGSRYSLAKASGIPASTLQNYTLGSKPGIDALATLARVGNVDLTWLLTGQGRMRGTGQLPGAALADVVMVDQYDPKSSLQIPVIVSQIPFSRHYLESNLRLNDPNHDSLLAIESVWDLFDILRGDLLLVDLKQGSLIQDGAYLLNLPGFSLRGIYNRPSGKLSIVEPRSARGSNSNRPDPGSRAETADSYQLDRRELLGDGRHAVSKVVGRVVWVGRAI